MQEPRAPSLRAAGLTCSAFSVEISRKRARTRQRGDSVPRRGFLSCLLLPKISGFKPGVFSAPPSSPFPACHYPDCPGVLSPTSHRCRTEGRPSRSLAAGPGIRLGPPGPGIAPGDRSGAWRGRGRCAALGAQADSSLAPPPLAATSAEGRPGPGTWRRPSAGPRRLPGMGAWR